MSHQFFRHKNAEKYLIWCSLIYIALTIFDSPSKFVLGISALGSLYYIKDLILVTVIFTYSIKVFIETKLYDITLIYIVLIVFFSTVAMLFLGSFMQIAFGIRILLPILFGLLIAPTVLGNINRYLFYFKIFLGILIFGIFLNYFFRFPWEFFDYSVGSITIDVSKEWTAQGIRRLGGFSKSSVSASMYLLLFWVFLLVFEKNAKHIYLFTFLVGVAIILTTTKSSILCYMIILTIHLFYRVIKNKNFIKAVPMLALFIVILLPTAGSYIIPQSLFQTSETYRLGSFEERIYNSWPRAFTFVEDEGSVLTGRGVGGIGSAQSFFEPRNYMAGDNIFVFLYFYFGIISIPMLFLMPIMILEKDLYVSYYYYSYLIILFLYLVGITTSVLENPLVNIFIGLVLYQLHENKTDTSHKILGLKLITKAK